MSKMIFVNLPVRDLAKAKAFYEAIGAVNNPQFSDATSACMVVSDTIFVMLLTHDKWAFFTKKPIADSRNASEAMLAISCDTRQAVDTMTDAAAGFVRATAGRLRWAQQAQTQAAIRPRGRSTRPTRRSAFVCKPGG